jgi:hypothetical protein
MHIDELTRYCNIDFTDGYIAIIVKCHILDLHIDEHVDWCMEALRFHLKTSNATTVVNCNWFCEVYRFQTIRTLLYNNWLLWTVLEYWWLVIYKN